MSRTFQNGQRHIRVRGIRRKPADLQRLARAIIELAQAEAEAAARAEHEHQHQNNPTSERQAPAAPVAAQVPKRKTKRRAA